MIPYIYLLSCNIETYDFKSIEYFIQWTSLSYHLYVALNIKYMIISYVFQIYNYVCYIL